MEMGADVTVGLEGSISLEGVVSRPTSGLEADKLIRLPFKDLGWYSGLRVEVADVGGVADTGAATTGDITGISAGLFRAGTRGLLPEVELLGAR